MGELEARYRRLHLGSGVADHWRPAVLPGLDVAQFDGIRRLASNCSWWWAYQLGAVLCERPARFEVFGKHVTIEFRDGWTVQT